MIEVLSDTIHLSLYCAPQLYNIKTANFDNNKLSITDACSLVHQTHL